MPNKNHINRWFKKVLSPLALLSSLFIATSASAQQPKVYTEKQGRTSVEVYADNPLPIPYWVEIKFPKRKGLVPQTKAPFIFTLKPKSKRQKLMSLKANPNQGYSFQISTLIGKGPRPDRVKHNDSHIYLLPFEHGKKYSLGQGYFGGSTHRAPSGYALDFSMDEGTKIVAARAGIVADIKQDSNIGGPSAYYAEHGNVINIMHDDGSFASYAHIKQNGAKVRVGQKVQAGQVIALSGNTGQSSGPHLHFEVFTFTKRGDSQNLPTRFYHYDGSILNDLQQGKTYYSTHPGKPPYQVILGENLKNSDFEHKNTVIAQNDKIEIANEEIDDTIILYALNGYKSPKKIEVDIELENFRVSKKLPISKTLLPTSKSFLAILTPINKSKPASYRVSYKFWR